MKEKDFDQFKGKVIEYATLTPFAVEKVHVYDTFIIVSGNGYAVPLRLQHIDALLNDGRVIATSEVGESYEIKCI